MLGDVKIHARIATCNGARRICSTLSQSWRHLGRVRSLHSASQSNERERLKWKFLRQPLKT